MPALVAVNENRAKNIAKRRATATAATAAAIAICAAAAHAHTQSHTRHTRTHRDTPSARCNSTFNTKIVLVLF